MPAAAIVCVKCWTVPRAPAPAPAAPVALEPQPRWICLALALFLPIGLHRVLMGHLNIGLLQMLLFFCTCGVSGLWGWVDAAMILNGSLRMSDGQKLV